MRSSTLSRNSLRGVAGVGSRRAQKRSMKAWAASSVLTAFHAATSSSVNSHVTGPLPHASFCGERAANTFMLTAKSTAAVRSLRIVMISPGE
jgi:hypothetical protein